MKNKVALLASAALMGLTAAQAAAGDYYYSILAGANWNDDTRFSNAINATTTFTLDLNEKTGFILAGAVGRRMDATMKGLRLEVEAAYRENTANGLWTSASTGGTASSSTDDNHTSFALMANVWLDFDMMGLKPYVGGGIGWANVDFEGNTGSTSTGFSPFDGDDSGFAWQLGAGINFPIDDKMRLGIGYRYFEGPDVTIGAPDNDNVTTGDIETQSHSATVSLSVDL